MAYDAPQAPDGRARREHATGGLIGNGRRLVGSTIGLGLLAAVLGGLVWVTLANPPTARLEPGGGVTLGEIGLDQQSGVTVWFFLVGVVGGAVCGLLLGWLGRRCGWRTVVAVVVCCGIAAWGSGWTGEHLFGADPGTEARRAAVGTVITFAVHVDSWVAYLSWPIGGAAAVLLVVLGWPNDETPPATSEPSGTVVADV